MLGSRSGAGGGLDENVWQWQAVGLNLAAAVTHAPKPGTAACSRNAGREHEGAMMRDVCVPACTGRAMVAGSARVCVCVFVLHDCLSNSLQVLLPGTCGTSRAGWL